MLAYTCALCHPVAHKVWGHEMVTRTRKCARTPSQAGTRVPGGCGAPV